MPQGDDGPGDGHIVRVGGEVAHERLVHFQLVDGKPLQVVERGIPGAEIVDGKLDADLLEFLEHRDGQFDVAHGDAFGHLQLQVARREPGLRQDALDHTGQVAAVELARRNVDRHGEVGRTRQVPPCAGLGAGAAQHPFADGHDQAAFLGQGNEFGRRNRAAVRMAPAYQGFHAHDAPARNAELGLIMQRQLIAFQGVAQRISQLQPVERAGVHFLRVALISVAAAPFHGVRRALRVLDQRDGVLPVGRINGDAGAERDEELAPVDPQRFLHVGGNALREPHRRVLNGQGRHQDGKPIAFQTVERAAGAHFIAALQRRLEPLAHRLQQPVSHRVAEAVVDLLEPVHVEHHHRRTHAFAATR